MADEAAALVINRILERLVKAAARKVRPTIPSKTLRAALQLKVTGNKAVLFIPHYWAIYLHDGRGPVRPIRKRWLVWFPNIKNDPRVGGGKDYPVRVSQIRSLTKEQWRKGLEENKRRSRQGLPPYMIVTRISGPARGTPFFGNLDVRPEASIIVPPVFDAYIRGLANSLSEKSTATISIR